MTAREGNNNESYTKYGTVKTEKEMGTNTSKERNCTHHNSRKANKELVEIVD